VGKGAVMSPPPPEETPQKRRLTCHQISLIDEQSATIENTETREAFVALMKASFENAR
jgi:hypothetical protein